MPIAIADLQRADRYVVIDDGENIVGTMDAAGDSTSNGGQNDANVAIACDGDDPCTRADFSRCEKESDTCKPCRASG